MVLPIYIYGHPVLRAENAAVTPDFPDLKELIENMKETMYHTQGIGIAAPQVGVNARIVYIDVDVLAEDFPELKDVRMVLINPEITVDENAPFITREEGCLSVPGYRGKCKRPMKVWVEALNENGEEISFEAEGFLAVICCHEFDHLDGILYKDKAIEFERAEED